MKRSYVIIAPPNSSLSNNDIQSAFSERWIAIIPNQAWAVSTEISTCVDVRNRLVGEASKTTVVVLRLTEYNGYASMALWEKLSDWSDG